MKTVINCKEKSIDLSTPKVMGILNLTPDSFYDGGKFQLDYLQQTELMLESGACFIDIGGMSSRPKSEFVSEEEELKRIMQPIEEILKRFPEALLSIDTFRSNVAQKTIEAGAAMINDISGGELDEILFDTIAELKVPYILMHMKGIPKNMQEQPIYENILKEVEDFFSCKLKLLHEKGVEDIIIDLGFGFGKTNTHNYTLLKNLSYFKKFELPILTGISRKSMINSVLKTKPAQALNGTTALHMIALMNGTQILRVHDVKEACQCVDIFNELQNS